MGGFKSYLGDIIDKKLLKHFDHWLKWKICLVSLVIIPTHTHTPTHIYLKNVCFREYYALLVLTFSVLFLLKTLFYVDEWQKPTKYWKTTILQLK